VIWPCNLALTFSKEKSFDIVGLGRNSWDRIMLVDHFPKPDTKIEAKEVSNQAGGQVATTLVTAARLGASVRYIGKFGDDAAGRAVRSALAREGVDLLASKVVHLVSNQISFVIVDQAHHTRNVFSFADPRLRFTKDDFKSDNVVSGKILFLGGRYPKDILPFAKLGRKENCVVIVDADYFEEDIDELFQFCDVVICPEPFIKEYSRESNVKKGLRKVLSVGPTIVCCTRGENGAAAYFEKEYLEVVAPETKVLDTTGAGDVFQGAFLVGLLNGESPLEILQSASAAAALKCKHLGGQYGIPNQKELKSFLKRIYA